MRTISTALLVFLVLCSRANALDITSCNVSVPAGETGVLQADLDCSGGGPDHHISLGHRAALDLNGHSVFAAPGAIAVACMLSGRCLVRGPGTISGGGIGIYVNRSITIENLTVQGADYGISGSAKGTLSISGVDVIGSTHTGIEGARLELTDVSVTGSGWFGIRASTRLRATNLVSSTNGGAGIETNGPFSISGLVANDNGQVANREGAGLLAFRKGKLATATLTGNTYSNPSLGPLSVDVFSLRPLAAVGLTCDHSLKWISPDEAGQTLGLCALD